MTFLQQAETETLELLEWPTLCEHLQQSCLTPLGVRQWEVAAFESANQLTALQQHQAEVLFLMRLLQAAGEPTLTQSVKAVEHLVDRTTKGGMLPVQDLFALLTTLQGMRQLLSWVRQHSTPTLVEEYSSLFKIEEPEDWQVLGWLDDVTVPIELLEQLEGILDHTGSMRDEASETLRQLRQAQRQLKVKIDGEIQRIKTNSTYRHAFQDGTETVRDGRIVFAIKAGTQGDFPGIILGSSSSGATLYVEPKPLTPLNNQQQQLLSEIEQAIQAILKEVARDIAHHSHSILAYLAAMAKLDKRMGSAILCRRLHAEAVVLHPATGSTTDARKLYVQGIRHPLLVLKQGIQKVVPNTVVLGNDQVRTLLITGPNTGGKTVLLKTLGLAALMTQAGLPLPTESYASTGEPSQFPLFQTILIDVGDQQSIDQNLSTFSGHLKRLVSFLQAEPLAEALVLIDEIGAGTDPVEGSALAQAILDELYERGALSVATTHFSALKNHANDHPGFTNGSMSFDGDTLAPTYRFLQGIPGTSHALTIAARYGMPSGVLLRAEAAMSSPDRAAAQLSEDLVQKHYQLQSEVAEVVSLRQKLAHDHEELLKEQKRVRDQKRQVVQEFRSSVKGRLRSLEGEIKNLRKALGQYETEHPDIVNLARQGRSLHREAEGILDDLEQPFKRLAEADAEQKLPQYAFKEGQEVRCERLAVTGKIISFQSDGQVVLQSGNIKMTLAVTELEPVMPFKRKTNSPWKSTSLRSKRIRKPRGGSGEEFPAEFEDDSPKITLFECDVRGKRVEEALTMVETFLDEALLAGHGLVGIIHGQGTGALKHAIREQLAASPYAKTFYPAEATQGGDGKTVVEMA